jgi:hypothetical protein
MRKLFTEPTPGTSERPLEGSPKWADSRIPRCPPSCKPSCSFDITFAVTAGVGPSTSDAETPW